MQTTFQNKIIIVAGAAGFIPGHLCEKLLGLGAYVIGLDNFVTGTKSTIDHLKTFKNFSFYECNIYEKLPQEILAIPKIDFIFSMASPASPIDFPTIPLEIILVNSEGTRKLLELAKMKNALFLEASTSEVYGDPEVHPQSEDYWGNVNCIGPRSCYDESKRFAETLTTTYHNLYKIPVRIVRIFNTYGPRMRPDDGRVIPNFINQAINHQPLTVNGDGLQTRSFCYVSDLVEGILGVVLKGDQGPVNVGNELELTVLDTAKLIIKLTKSQSTINFNPLPENDPKKRRPNLTKIKSLFEYEPKISLEEGLQKTISYFRNLLTEN
jgi:dTDP-glucose 4,6-dehydratase